MNPRLRVLAVGSMYPPHHLGGYEVIWQGTRRDLQARGIEMRILASDYSHPGVSQPEEPDVHRELRWYWADHDFPEHTARERFAIERHNRRTLARHLADQQPDVVMWWAMGGMSMALMEQVRRAGIPALGFVADSWMDYAFDRDEWQRAWRNRPGLASIASRLTSIAAGVEPGPQARWLFISNAIRETSRKEKGWDLPDTAIAHSGIDPQRFPPSAPQPWAWRLGYVGRIDERKGVASAIRALKLLPDAATLDVQGDGDETHAEELRALVAELGLEDRVTFRPAGRAPAEAYAAADVVLFPVTWDEPWGLVPLEAMGVGRPVVATGTGGSAEYLRDGENCLLFTPGDPQALADAVRRLGEDEALRQRIVAAGAQTAAHFTEAAFNDEVEKHLLDVAARAGRAGR